MSRQNETPLDKPFLALSISGQSPPDWGSALRSIGLAASSEVICSEETRLWVGNLGEDDSVDDSTGEVNLLLTRAARVEERDVTRGDIKLWLGAEAVDENIWKILPPFAAIFRSHRRGPLRFAVDALGLRHIYYATYGNWCAVSSSPVALAALASGGLNPSSWAALSLLGWQMGDATAFEGVKKIPAGHVVSMQRGELHITSRTANFGLEEGLTIEQAVQESAGVLRDFVGAFLDDHPESLLQLTGGQDSRILLGAIAAERRGECACMTLEVPGSADVGLARSITQRYGMTHLIVNQRGLEALSPAAAHSLVQAHASRLAFAADPLASAALFVAEAAQAGRPRLSGLGGEVVRGFYYAGPPMGQRVTSRRIRQLARWRLFPNEAVPPGVLGEEFAQWGRAVTLAKLEEIFTMAGPQWYPATDEFYVSQRIQRWAGVLASSTCYDRYVVNPMLDHRFLAIAQRLPSRLKSGSRFLASIMECLDGELAALPMDGRPPPAVYARPGFRRSLHLSAATLNRVAGKASQRLRQQRRPAAGSEVLARFMQEHWRSRPDTLEPVRATGYLSEAWLTAFLSGSVDASPAAIAFMSNLLGAVTALDRGPNGVP